MPSVRPSISAIPPRLRVLLVLLVAAATALAVMMVTRPAEPAGRTAGPLLAAPVLVDGPSAVTGGTSSSGTLATPRAASEVDARAGIAPLRLPTDQAPLAIQSDVDRYSREVEREMNAGMAEWTRQRSTRRGGGAGGAGAGASPKRR